ncbi:putative nitrate excretion transporter 2 [Platanthera zijinensis]|uniref:Nitrate excretion transporter 2 n=1 Tax=Platanthera zijinensis TaxID=2320716 RepID=A0AAP0G9S8_9ASPA
MGQGRRTWIGRAQVEAEDNADRATPLWPPRVLAMMANRADMFKPLAGGSLIQGGWITFPFIAGSILSTVLASGGAMGNFMVYLITEFNMSSVKAAQINNVINGCINLAPIAGAIIADAFFGSYPVIVASSFVNLLAMIVFTLTATIRSLRPSACLPGADSCAPATAGQLALLYSALALLAVGTGGARFNTMTMGADQFERSDQREVFFNWIFLIIYVAAIIGSTAIVYVEDSLSWGIGFGICAALTAGGLGMLLAGTRFYRRTKTRGSAFTGPARVVVAAVRKRKTPLSPASLDGFYCGAFDGSSRTAARAPTQSLRFLNHAAVIVDGDVSSDGSVRHPWRLCTVEQVEDLKVLLRLFPLWSSSIFLSVPLGIQFSLSVLQSLAMDRSLGRHFSVPAGSILVANLAAVAVTLPIIDRLVPPLCLRLAGVIPTPIHRIGAGHVFNIAGMAASALVDRRRLGIVRSHASAAVGPGWIAPMSAMWLVLPLAVSGIGEALHFPGQISMYYQEFPVLLRSTAGRHGGAPHRHWFLFEHGGGGFGPAGHKLAAG